MFEKVLIWYREIYQLDFIAFRYFQRTDLEPKKRRTSSHRDASYPRTCSPGGAARQKDARGDLRHGLSSRPTARASRDCIHIKDLAQATHALGLKPTREWILQPRQWRRLFCANRSSICAKEVTGAEDSGHRNTASSRAIRPSSWPRRNKAIRKLGWKPQNSEDRGYREDRLDVAQGHPDGYAGQARRKVFRRERRERRWVGMWRYQEPFTVQCWAAS